MRLLLVSTAFTMLLQSPVKAIELLEEDKQMCSTFSKIASTIQQHRRNTDATKEEAIQALIPDESWLEVYEAMAEKVYNAPKAVPPIALAINFNGHCVNEMQRIRELQLES